ncbi:hypothetical protein ACTJI8_13800 [Microbacterium sp. 22303]|uniref:hypothetical protein n=1 Tax=Microbacterium sp. 22303 TaxID=3453905 RepID=UPI003F85DEB3
MKAMVRAGGGQILVVLATLVPVIARQNSALTASVFCGSVAGLLLMPLLAAVPARLPGVRSDADAQRMVGACARVLLTLAGVAILAGIGRVIVFTFGDVRTWSAGKWNILDVALGVLLLMIAQGAYAIVVSWSTRQADMNAIARLRMSYGVAAIVAALLAVLFGDGFFPVIVASSIGLLVSATMTVILKRGTARALVEATRAVRFRTYLGIWGSGWRLALASMANGFTAQAAALVLPALGSLAELWAIVFRVGGGFATIMQTVVAPFIEKELGAATRTQDIERFKRAASRGWMVGIAGAIAAASLGVLAVGYTHGRDQLIANLLVLGTAASLLFGGQIGNAPISRALSIVGWQHAQLAWDVCRLVVVGVLVLLLRGAPLLLSIGATLFLFGIAFGLLVLRAPKAMQWGDPSTPSQN